VVTLTRSRDEAVGETASVPVALAGSRIEAELIAGMLRNNGVRAVVSADDAGGLEPQWQLQGVRVLVASSDEALARRLLADADDTRG
jgi:Putative prokaryotic signal transducing protein